VVIWTLIYMQRKMSLGWMANAVRDNPEWAQFVSYNTAMVRFIEFSLSAFFAGLVGAVCHHR
jgi:branched-chain amino acid transport system permease protein